MHNSKKLPSTEAMCFGIPASWLLRDAPISSHFCHTVLPFWPLHRNLASNNTRTRFLVCYNAIEQLHGVLEAFSSFFRRNI